MAASASAIRHHLVPGGALIAVSGPINEDFEGARLTTGASGVVVLDLEGVDGITSFGVRQWMRALKALPVEYLGFVNCRPSIIAHFNSVTGFAGGGQVLSFYLPFMCGKCWKEVEVLVDLRAESLARIQERVAQPQACPACGGEVTFDDLPAAYLGFLKGASKPTPPPLAEALMDGKPPPAVPFRVEKEVVDRVTILRLSGSLDQSARVRRYMEGLEGNVLVFARGVQSVTPEGFAGLWHMMSQPGPRFFLAGVGPALLGGLGGPGPADVTVVSVALPLRCPGCSATWVAEVNPRSSGKTQAGKLSPSCPVCSRAIEAEVSEPLAEVFARLTSKSVPDEVMALLHRSVAERAEPGEGPSRSFGRYELLNPIAMGGMAEVFLARQTGTAGFQKTVVIKRILPHLCRDESFVTMFLEEARLAARIDHPNVVQIFDVGEIQGRHFMCLEYVRGRDLNAILRSAKDLGEQMPLELVARVIADVAAGLHAAHTCVDDQGKPHPTIHRDVSPHNILISTRGEVKIADFGIAKASDNISLTPTSLLKGKIGYLAPEQVTQKEALSPAADLFALGVVLFEAVTQHKLFERSSSAATLAALLNDPIPDPATLRPGIPPLLVRVMRRALERDPADRYPSGLLLQQDLEALIASLGGRAGQEELARWTGDVLQRSGNLTPDRSWGASTRSDTDAPTPTLPLVTTGATKSS